MTFNDHVTIITKLAAVDLDAAYQNAWRFAREQGGPGWERSMTSVLKVYEYVTKLLRLCKILTAHRQRYNAPRPTATLTPAERRRRYYMLENFKPIHSAHLLFRAKRPAVERFLKLTAMLYGTRAALWQRALLNRDYPTICGLTRKDKDTLAHMNVMALPRIAEIRASDG